MSDFVHGLTLLNKEISFTFVKLYLYVEGIIYNISMKKLFILFAVVVFTSVQVFAQTALIVKQDGARVYLDISDFKEKPKVNDTFTVTFWGGEIKNPKTGKILGKTIERRLNGKITEVEPLYAIGSVNNIGKEDKLEGIEANITILPQVAPQPAVQQAGQNSQKNNLPHLWQSKPLDGKALAFTAGDITGSGESNLVIAYDDNNIITYNLQDDKLNKVSEFKSSPIQKIISLDNADLDGNGKAEIFISYFDTVRNHFNTAVYEIENNTWTEKANFRGLVKGIAPFNGKRVLYTQNIDNMSGKFRALTPAILEYKDGKYQAGKQLKSYKFQSIYGFNVAEFDEGKQNVIYTQPSGKLRIQFDKKSSYINSPSEFNFASTPNRIKFDNDIIKFYSSLALSNADGGFVVAGLENEAKLGILSSTFGYYQSGKLVLLKWDGSSLNKFAEAPLGGYTVDLQQGTLGNYQDVLIVPFINGAGKTTVVLYSAK